MVNTSKVLIVGAGPTGLMMAYALARQGIQIQIIDKKSARTPSSNATWVQARTLEIFDQLGLLDSFKHYGHSCDTIYIHPNGEDSFSISFKEANSISPFILMLPQSKTEQILEDALNQLGYYVERNVELLDVKQDDAGVTAFVRIDEDKKETLKTEWLIGCDGANSQVREACNLSFSGSDLKEQFLVADATINFSHFSKDQFHYYFSQGTLLTIFPLGENKYRIAANLHLPYLRKLLTTGDVIDIVQERAQGSFHISSVEWISPFWIHSKLVTKMRQASIFLAGDAAHILSPAAGQGMNMGIQDAYNLAWKLGFVIKSNAKTSLLDTYHSERHPVAEKTVSENEYYTKMVLFDDRFDEKLDKFKNDLSQKTAYWTEKIYNQVSQLDIHYHAGFVTESSSSKGNNLLKPGTSAPDAFIQNSTLYKFFDYEKFNILLFTGVNPDSQLELLIDLYQRLKDLNSRGIQTQLISISPIKTIPEVLLDSDKSVHKRYKVVQPAIYILRPDTYIALCLEDINYDLITHFFESNLWS